VIERLWLVRGTTPAATRRAPEHIVPDGCPELIVHLGDPFERRVRGRWTRQPRAFLAGTLTRPWHVRPGRRALTLGLRFRPGAVRAIFALELSSATDREVPLARLVGAREAAALVARLEAAAGARGAATSALFRAAEAWLAARLAAARTRPSETTRRAVARILRARGRERVEDAATALGTGRRSLERAFAKDLGISPKRFARIVRLNAVLSTLGHAERARAVDVALEAGYFDQAHLARDFRDVAGRRATRGRELDGELARHFTAPERLLALLEGE
jgi:methylphosphotriester-DNA--protein-cysteine methyltransferase